MKYLFLLTTLVIFSSCNSVKKATKVDQTNPAQVAGASLDYFKLKDLESLQYLSTNQKSLMIQRVILTNNSSSKEAIFSGWRWDKVQQWDGKIREVRFADDLKTAYAVFHMPNNAQANTSFGLVSLLSEDNKWKFNDIHQYTKAEFEGLGYVMDKSSK